MNVKDNPGDYIKRTGPTHDESKIIEAAEVIRSITTGQSMWPTFETGHHICQIVDACMESSRLGRWVSIA